MYGGISDGKYRDSAVTVPDNSRHLDKMKKKMTEKIQLEGATQSRDTISV